MRKEGKGERKQEGTRDGKGVEKRKKRKEGEKKWEKVIPKYCMKGI